MNKTVGTLGYDDKQQYFLFSSEIILISAAFMVVNANSVALKSYRMGIEGVVLMIK